MAVVLFIFLVSLFCEELTVAVVASLQFGGSEAGEKRYLVLVSSMIQCLWGAEFLTAHQKLMLSSFLLRENEQ